MIQASVAYKTGLKEDLSDPEQAAAYLNAAIADGSPEVLLMALRDVGEALGAAEMGSELGLKREDLDRVLSGQADPVLSRVATWLDSLGLRLAVEVKHPAAA